MQKKNVIKDNDKKPDKSLTQQELEILKPQIKGDFDKRYISIKKDIK